MQLFGTDGIRGKVEIDEQPYDISLSQFLKNRILTPSLMRLIGEAIAIDLNSKNNNNSLSPRVVIGWDNRPNNILLVSALTEGLTIQGCEVHWAGEIATPGLHYCILESEFCTGLMVTASHNPAQDSGLKIFDEFGFKSYPEKEKELSKIINNLSEKYKGKMYKISENLRTPTHEFNGLQKYQINLENRLFLIQNNWGVSLSQASDLGVIPPNAFIFDSSKGAIYSWSSLWFSDMGLSTIEVSKMCNQINDNCGAGNFSPTDRWTWKNLESEHVLLQAINKTFKSDESLIPGQILAAAVDGDADRCLLFEVMDDLSGIRVVDGDRISDYILQAASIIHPKSSWLFAASIESDLSLLSSLDRLSLEIDSLETAVGDRWLSLALCGNINPNLISCSKMPLLLGCEDSGHIVLPVQHPLIKDSWSLVGDGLMTFIYTILAKSVINLNEKSNNFSSGWKLRRSVKEVNRDLWNGNNNLSNQAKKIVEKWFAKNSNFSGIRMKKITGATTLLLLEGEIDSLPFSLGIRNSGTEAKISVSLRLSSGCKEKILSDPSTLVEELCDFLSIKMS